jgi:hypothetical protein
MPDEPKPAPPPSPEIPRIFEWTSMSQGDLGMKAVYWTDETKTTFKSRPIVGWLTFSVRSLESALPFNHFSGIVINDNWVPAPVGALRNLYCIAPKDATDDEILAKFPPSGPSAPPIPQGVGGTVN